MFFNSSKAWSYQFAQNSSTKIKRCFKEYSKRVQRTILKTRRKNSDAGSENTLKNVQRIFWKKKVQRKFWRNVLKIFWKKKKKKRKNKSCRTFSLNVLKSIRRSSKKNIQTREKFNGIMYVYFIYCFFLIMKKVRVVSLALLQREFWRRFWEHSEKKKKKKKQRTFRRNVQRMFWKKK